MGQLVLCDLLTEAEIEQLHHAALQVLQDVGVQVESEPLLKLLGEYGAAVDLASRRARFSSRWVEEFIQSSDRYDWSQHRPSISCSVGIFAGPYLNPNTDELEPFTETTFRDYVRLANGLRAVSGVGTLGLPFTPEGIPPAYAALSEKLYGWRHRCHPSGTVQFTGLCPFLVEMYARRAEETGQRMEEVFSAIGYLISPLRLAAAECEQVLYFRSQGLRMSVGHLLSLGGSAPVTIAGAATLNLAQSIFLSILHRALWGDRSLGIGGSTMVMDLRTCTSLYGRPEQSVISSILGQMARFYGAYGGSHGGLTDAKEPSVQAGMQKAMTAVAGLYSCGSGFLAAGSLSIDEICSPEQMVYDAELAEAIARMLRPIEVNDETCAVEEIKNIGPGGFFAGTDLTANRFREEMWQPTIWARESLQGWLSSGAPTDRAKARNLIHEILAEPAPEPGLSEEAERDLRSIIARAVAANAVGRRVDRDKGLSDHMPTSNT